MENRTFKKKDLSKIFDEKEETIRSWINKGNVPVLERVGRGQVHIFGLNEVLQKKITTEDWYEIIEEGKTFFVLENFEHCKTCQVRSFNENEGPFVVDPGAEGVMILNGKRLLEEVKAKIEKNFL